MKAILILLVGCDTYKVYLEGDDACADPPCTSGDPADPSANDDETGDTGGGSASSGRWEGDVALADVGLRLSGVYAGGRAGWDLEVGDIDADGRVDLVVGAPMAGARDACEGRVYAVNGPISAGGSLGDLSDGIVSGQSYDCAGQGIAFVGDAEGDGHADLVVAGAGIVARFSEGIAGELSLGAAGTIWRDSDERTFGANVAALGDASGDGVVDLLVASPGYYDASGYGEAWVFSGAASRQDLDTDHALAHIHSNGKWLGTGTAVGGPGDVDGDGVDDVMVSAIDPETWHSVVAFFPGPVEGELSFDDAQGHIIGSGVGDYLGGQGASFASTIRPAGDGDGDGYRDVWMTAPGSGSQTARGAVYMIPGPLYYYIDPADAVVTIEGTAEQGTLGIEFAVTDLDGDEESDLVVSGLGADYAGSVNVFYGPVRGRLQDTDADATFHGGTLAGYAGISLAGGSDLTGDGLPDLAVGAALEYGDAEGAGNVWILPGR